MKKLLSFVLVCVLLVSLIPCAFAASDEAVSAANALYALGLFNGTGTGPDGKPNFDLDRTPTRHESITMLVRLLGKETEAKSKTWSIPFTDVADWAKPYVGYAYANGLTNGTSDTTYDGDNTITASQYLTLALRALGYKSGSDFQWDKAWVLSDSIGLTSGQYNENTKLFTRGDVAIVSNRALDCKLKGQSITLRQQLPSTQLPPENPKDNIAPIEVAEKIVNATVSGVNEYYDGFRNCALSTEYAANGNYSTAVRVAIASQGNFYMAEKHFADAYILCGNYDNTQRVKQRVDLMGRCMDIVAKFIITRSTLLDYYDLVLKANDIMKDLIPSSKSSTLDWMSDDTVPELQSLIDDILSDSLNE